jgi:hypothetical protein
MTKLLFSSENQQYAVEYRRVVGVAIYVIPNEAKPQSVYALLVYGPDLLLNDHHKTHLFKEYLKKWQ